jgi:hypothetical protein
MAASLPIPSPASDQDRVPSLSADQGQPLAGVEVGVADDQAMVPVPHHLQFRKGIAVSAQISRLPVELDVSVPVRNFRVRNLLALEPAHLIESDWPQSEDMPLAAGAVQLAWSEFEVVDTRLLMTHFERFLG